MATDIINFCFDRMSTPGVLGYPNLAADNLNGDEFDFTWPKTIPLRLEVYFKRANILTGSYLVKDAPVGSWYPIALGWHDFECDYMDLIPQPTLSRIKQKEIKILFYYHEGDNPQHIKERLDTLCHLHNMPSDCYLFISANTSADKFDNFYYFPDHEHFFRYVNRRQSVAPISFNEPRPFEFTVLNRTHKWWRASCMADLVTHGILDQSLWSYNTKIDINDREEDNPLQLDVVPGWRQQVKNFVNNGPYFCDSNDDAKHNDHRSVPLHLYRKSYCHLVIETLFDADGSGGTFLTEKTYKPIKFGQPFIIVGPPGSLQALRDQGYDVFDRCINNNYDTITDNTERWFSIKSTIQDLRKVQWERWFLECREGIEHNQNLFQQLKSPSLNKLLERLLCRN